MHWVLTDYFSENCALETDRLRDDASDDVSAEATNKESSKKQSVNDMDVVL